MRFLLHIGKIWIFRMPSRGTEWPSIRSICGLSLKAFENVNRTLNINLRDGA